MVSAKRSAGVFVAALLVVGCLAIAPFAKTEVAVADTGFAAATSNLQAQVSNKPTEKLVKQKLYFSGSTLYFVWGKAAASDWRYGITGYQVQSSKASSIANGSKIETYEWDSNQLTISSTKVNTRYYVRVRLFNNVNGHYYYGPWSKTYTIMRTDSSSSASSNAKVTKYTPTQIPTLKLTAGKKKITAKYSQASKWITNGGGSDAKVSGYEIWWTKKSDSNWKNKHVKYVKTQSKTKVSLTALTPGKKYMVAVRLYNTVKGVTYYGSWSTVKYATPTKK